VTEQRALKWAIVLGATGLVIYLCLVIVHPFLHVLAWSTVLAITCDPLYQRLLKKTRRVALSAFLSSAVAVVAIVLPLVVLGGIAVTQAVALGESLQGAFEGQPDARGRLAAAAGWVLGRVGMDGDQFAAWAGEHAGELTRDLGQYTVSVAAGVTDAIASFVFIVFALFLLLRDGHRIVATILDLLPFERSRSESVFLRIRDVVLGSVHGVVVIALIQGALCGGMFWLLGIPSAALWGMATVFTSVLPVVGSAAVWVPGTIYLALTGAWPKAILLAIWGAAVVSSVDNFLRPRLVGGRVGLSELVMFFALLGGLRAFGVVGIVLGPVIFATASAIVDILAGHSQPPERGIAPPDRRTTPSAIASPPGDDRKTDDAISSGVEDRVPVSLPASR
jgi:predicted PurR-regulated permease PerM